MRILPYLKFRKFKINGLHNLYDQHKCLTEPKIKKHTDVRTACFLRRVISNALLDIKELLTRLAKCNVLNVVDAYHRLIPRHGNNRLPPMSHGL